MLQVTVAFPGARCIQDAVDKGVRGNVVPRPAPLYLLFRSGHLRGTRFPSSDLRLFSPMKGTRFPSSEESLTPLRSSDDDSDICFLGCEAACILCDEIFQIYKNFTKLRILQATDVFPGARCIQDAVDKGVRGNVVPRPAPLSFLCPERASQGNPVPLI